MSTLAVLKAEIADDLSRSDMTDAIAAEIPRAIQFYQNQRLTFTEQRDITFTTVADQVWYSASDDADIAKFMSIDSIFVTDSGSNIPLQPTTVASLKRHYDDGASTGTPWAFVHHNKQIGLYPIPDAAYTITINGVYMISGPASDSEANNPWMLDAFDLIRATVAAKVAALKIRDLQAASVFQGVADIELNRLQQEASSRASTNIIQPVTF